MKVIVRILSLLNKKKMIKRTTIVKHLNNKTLNSSREEYIGIEMH